MNKQESVNEMTSMLLDEGLMTEDQIKRSSEDSAPESNKYPTKAEADEFRKRIDPHKYDYLKDEGEDEDFAPDSNNTESEDLERDRRKETEMIKMNNGNIKQIPLSRLAWNQNDDGLLWPYREIDAKHIDSLVSLNEPHTWENIQVVPKDYHFNPNGYFLILDGQHRVMAARIFNVALSDEQIPEDLKPFSSLIRSLEDQLARNEISYQPITTLSAIVRTDIKNDLQASVAMWQANLRHGKAPSFAEKKAHLEWLLEKEMLDEDMTERQIAAMVGLSLSTVHRVLNSDEESVDRRANQDDSRAFLRSLVKLHQREGSLWTGNKLSGSFKKFLYEQMTDDKEVNKAIHVLAKSLNEIVETFDARKD